MTILELLKEYRIPYREEGQHHHCTPGFVQVDCPLCTPKSNSWRLGLSLDGRAANCWVCGRQRVGEMLGLILDVPEPWKLLTYSDFPQIVKAKKTGKLKMPAGIGPLLPQHIKYLKHRKLDPVELTELWGIKGIGLAPPLSWRIFIPIFLGGEIVSWTTRSISNQVSKRYVNARTSEEAISAKDLLYGEQHAKHALIVTEGPFDALRVGPGAVSLNGIAYSRKQVLRISHYPVRAICFDNEPQAQQRAQKLAHELECFPGDTYVVQLDAKDPGSANDREIALLRESFLS